MQTASTRNNHSSALVDQDFLVTDTTVCEHVSTTAFMATAHIFPTINVFVIWDGQGQVAVKTVAATITALATAENVIIVKIIQPENTVSCVGEDHSAVPPTRVLVVRLANVINMGMNLEDIVTLKLVTVFVCIKLKEPTANAVNLASTEIQNKVDTALWSARIGQ